ncbi:FecCD family ABC transporter permease [Methylobacterium sp. E-045]|uniref:FecCD family ABC transporter permease n=1 Tax=Methylobacterium sp. E-045 TaxID=2836575 RepID=UPI001FBAA63A|nr:iron ABC transporter permease [Methylobacterium sp. E-045]MCJ2131715.1 iron ABC transporter permease [Methylobacterium sp. E-045]
MRRIIPALAIAASCTALFGLAVFLGTVDVAPADVFEVLAGRGSGLAQLVVGELRLPRVLTGMLVGAHFALAGFLLQAITRNPLADPSIIGVSQGATLAVTVFLLVSVYGGAPGQDSLYALPEAWLPAVGLGGGVLTGLTVYFLALRHDIGPLRVTLCGIAVGAVLQALAVGIIAGWGTSRIEILLQWLSGSLYARSWDDVAFLAPFTTVGVIALSLVRRPVDLLGFEVSTARAMGLAYGPYFTLVLVLACGLAASAVGVVGPLAFVGLVVPHVARAAAGARPGLVLSLTAILGAALVTAADLLGRLVGGTEEIPVGVVTAILGAPALIILLRRLP